MQPRGGFFLLRHIIGLSRKEDAFRGHNIFFCLVVYSAQFGTTNKKILIKLLFQQGNYSFWVKYSSRG